MLSTIAVFAGILAFLFAGAASITGDTYALFCGFAAAACAMLAISKAARESGL